jgi:DNA-binding MarR family transcriptional regulator
MRLSAQSALLASRLGIDQGRLQQLIDSLEGEDAHDWVDRIAQEYGRQVTLRLLAQLWCELHPDEALEIVTELRAGLSAIVV